MQTNLLPAGVSIDDSGIIATLVFDTPEIEADYYAAFQDRRSYPLSLYSLYTWQPRWGTLVHGWVLTARAVTINERAPIAKTSMARMLRCNERTVQRLVAWWRTGHSEIRGIPSRFEWEAWLNSSDRALREQGRDAQRGWDAVHHYIRRIDDRSGQSHLYCTLNAEVLDPDDGQDWNRHNGGLQRRLYYPELYGPHAPAPQTVCLGSHGQTESLSSSAKTAGDPRQPGSGPETNCLGETKSLGASAETTSDPRQPGSGPETLCPKNGACTVQVPVPPLPLLNSTWSPLRDAHEALLTHAIDLEGEALQDYAAAALIAWLDLDPGQAVKAVTSNPSAPRRVLNWCLWFLPTKAGMEAKGKRVQPSFLHWHLSGQCKCQAPTCDPQQEFTEWRKEREAAEAESAAQARRKALERAKRVQEPRLHHTPGIEAPWQELRQHCPPELREAYFNFTASREFSDGVLTILAPTQVAAAWLRRSLPDVVHAARKAGSSIVDVHVRLAAPEDFS